MSTGALVGRLLRRLVEVGIVDAEPAMAGRVTVTDMSRSNLVSLVSVDGQPVAVVKRGSVSADGVEPFEAELAAYRWLARSSATAGLAPRLLRVLPDDGAIVVRPVAGAVSVHEALGVSPGRAGAMLTELGRVLGTLHAAPNAAALEARRPWILDVPSGRTPAMFTGNDAVGPVLDRIRSHRALTAAIARLDAGTAARTVIHGDLKFDNVLLAGGRLVLVDWELAGLGAPVWDLAGVVDGLLLPGLLGAGRAARVDQAELARMAAPALAGHRDVAGPACTPSPDNLAVAVVARLAQTALQLAAMSHERPEARAGAGRILTSAEGLAEELAVARCPA